MIKSNFISIFILLLVGCSANTSVVDPSKNPIVASPVDSAYPYRQEGVNEIPRELGVSSRWKVKLDSFKIDLSKKYLLLAVDDKVNLTGAEWDPKYSVYYPTVDDLYQFNEIGYLVFAKEASLPDSFDFSHFPELREVDAEDIRLQQHLVDDLLMHSKKLKGINLKGIKSLPDCICELDHLERLRIYAAGTLDVPDCMSEMKNLKQLEIGGLDTVDETVWNIASLQTLEIRGNHFGAIPKTLGTMKNLLSLKINVVGTIHFPEEFGELESLENLEISGVKDTLKLPKQFHKLKNFKRLAMNHVKMKIFPDLSKCNLMCDVNVTAAYIDSFVGDFSNMPYLQRFVIEGEIKYNSFPTGIEQSTLLGILSLKGWGFNELPPEIYSMAPTLQSIEIGAPLSYESTSKLIESNIEVIDYWKWHFDEAKKKQLNELWAEHHDKHSRAFPMLFTFSHETYKSEIEYGKENKWRRMYTKKVN